MEKKQKYNGDDQFNLIIKKLKYIFIILKYIIK